MEEEEGEGKKGRGRSKKGGSVKSGEKKEGTTPKAKKEGAGQKSIMGFFGKK